MTQVSEIVFPDLHVGWILDFGFWIFDTQTTYRQGRGYAESKSFGFCNSYTPLFAEGLENF